jgi:hypothetical protein
MRGLRIPSFKDGTTTMPMNRELTLVLLALAGLAIHALDETLAFGAPSGPTWPVIIAINVLFITLAGLHPRLGPWRVMPAALFALLGAFVVSSGWTAHVQPLLGREPGLADATGVVFVACGVLLLVSAGLLVQRVLASRRGAARPM